LEKVLKILGFSGLGILDLASSKDRAQMKRIAADARARLAVTGRLTEIEKIRRRQAADAGRLSA